jgi:hypothetical protein
VDVDDFDAAAEIHAPNPRDGRKRPKPGKAPVVWTYVALGVAALALLAIGYAVLSELIT